MADNRRSLSVLGFCQRAKDLLVSNQADFVRFVLAGQDPDGTQACIDPVFNRVAPDDQLVAIRDYEVFLLTKSFCFLSDTLRRTSNEVDEVAKESDNNLTEDSKPSTRHL